MEVREIFYAHSPIHSAHPWHELKQHLDATAKLASQFAKPFGAQQAAALAGLLHDLGKYSASFQARLRGASQRVDHATAGAQHVKALTAHAGPADQTIGWLISYAIAGHHAGLSDYHGAEGSSLSERLRKEVPPLAEAWRDEISPDAMGLWPQIKLTGSRQDRAFTLGFLGRMIFSTLVDADFKDTEAYHAAVGDYVRDRDWPRLQAILPALRRSFDAYMANLRSDSELGDHRHQILHHVIAGAAAAPRFFTLTVPTGGGKTLASLGFALEHAARHQMRRIIYAIPFTSVIEQTARVFRDALGDDILLEHHAALEQSTDTAAEARDKLRLAMEDWAAPVIVTTNVQLFESLFANRSSRCRKLHNIAGSIIILDEAQTLPRHLLRPAAMALKQLVQHYGCSIVLCTATQPALDASHFGADPVGLPLAGGELAPEPEKLAAVMRRAHIQHVGLMENAALVAALAARPQGLIIVNTRRHALDLYEAAQAAGLDGLYHLSTRQHAADRQQMLDEIRQRLKYEQPCHVIATALVEAGVDVDFPAVWRAEAGLDQIVQAAGRCNREGKQDWSASPVSVFVATSDYNPPREVKALAGDLDRVRQRHADLLHPAALQDYFHEVYWRLDDKLDRENILDEHAVQQNRPEIGYRSIAEKFQMIEDGQQPVIIPDHPDWPLLQVQIEQGFVSAGSLARSLQRHVVQIPRRHHADLLAQGDIRLLGQGGFYILQSAHLYSRECGLVWERAGEMPAQLSVI